MIKKFPLYRQLDAMDCGVACLRMVFEYYGTSVTSGAVRKQLDISRSGVNLLALTEAAEQFGFESTTVSVEQIDAVKEMDLPLILYWNKSHFVVLYKIKKGKFYIADPDVGKVSIDSKEFQTKWMDSGHADGIAIFLTPGPGAVNSSAEFKQGSTSRYIKKLRDFVKPFKYVLGWLFVILFISSVLQYLIPFVTRNIVDKGIGLKNENIIYVFVLAYFGLLFGRLIVELIHSRVLLLINSRVNLVMVKTFISKVMELDFSFFQTRQSSDVIQRINDNNSLESFITSSVIGFLVASSSLVVLSFGLGVFSPLILLFFLASTLIQIFIINFFLKKKEPLERRRYEVNARDSHSVLQIVNGIQDIKLNNAHKPLLQKWEEIRTDLLLFSRRVLTLSQQQRVASFFVGEGKGIFITLIAALEVLNGDISIGTMLAIQILVGQLGGAIEQLLGFFNSWQKTKISLERLEEVESYATDLRQQQINAQLLANEQSTEADYKIVFRDVSFRYPGAGNPLVLDHFNFEIPIGKTTAIVGVSGSGKTTILKMLLGMHKPISGDIIINGINLNSWHEDELHNKVSSVLQDSFVFSESIEFNITFGITREDYTQRLENVLRICNLSDFIKGLPMGLRTKIGSGGSGISAGQRQRVLIARALFRDAPFLLFDEATNNLDSENEEVIFRNIRQMQEDKTIIIVAHRLSSIKNVDFVVVMAEGKIIEHGSRLDLLQTKGAYYNLVSQQLQPN